MNMRKTVDRVRDSKTGRFANSWKADRWSDRFQWERVRRPKLPGIRRARAVERPERIPRDEIRGTFKDYAEGGTLLENFDLRTATFARDKINKNLFVIQVRSFSGKGSISFAVNVRTGKITEDKPYVGKKRK
jgi:hypothetical protein